MTVIDRIDELVRLFNSLHTIREDIMFSKVRFYDLKVGEKYKIYRNPCDIHNYYTGTVREHNTICVIMDRFIYHSNRKSRITGFRNNVKINNDYYYYAFVLKKEKIQQAMEKRALDKILKRIVNDDFSW